MKRSLAREQAFVLGFEKSFNDELMDDLVDFAVQNCAWEDDAFMRRLAEGTFIHLDEIDEIIERNCIGWKKNRISRVALSVMRLCVYEIFYEPDIPVGASIDEAVELAKKFATDDDAAYINGVLGSVARAGGYEKE